MKTWQQLQAFAAGVGAICKKYDVSLVLPNNGPGVVTYVGPPEKFETVKKEMEALDAAYDVQNWPTFDSVLQAKQEGIKVGDFSMLMGPAGDHGKSMISVWARTLEFLWSLPRCGSDRYGDGTGRCPLLKRHGGLHMTVDAAAADLAARGFPEPRLTAEYVAALRDIMSGGDPSCIPSMSADIEKPRTRQQMQRANFGTISDRSDEKNKWYMLSYGSKPEKVARELSILRTPVGTGEKPCGEIPARDAAPRCWGLLFEEGECVGKCDYSQSCKAKLDQVRASTPFVGIDYGTGPDATVISLTDGKRVYDSAQVVSGEPAENRWGRCPEVRILIRTGRSVPKSTDIALTAVKDPMRVQCSRLALHKGECDFDFKRVFLIRRLLQLGDEKGGVCGFIETDIPEVPGSTYLECLLTDLEFLPIVEEAARASGFKVVPIEGKTLAYTFEKLAELVTSRIDRNGNTYVFGEPHFVGALPPFALHGTVTGRFDSSKANLSNRPKCQHHIAGPCNWCDPKTPCLHCGGACDQHNYSDGLPPRKGNEAMLTFMYECWCKGRKETPPGQRYEYVCQCPGYEPVTFTPGPDGCICQDNMDACPVQGHKDVRPPYNKREFVEGADTDDERLECGEESIVDDGKGNFRCYDHAKLCKTCNEPSVAGACSKHPMAGKVFIERSTNGTEHAIAADTAMACPHGHPRCEACRAAYEKEVDPEGLGEQAILAEATQDRVLVPFDPETTPRRKFTPNETSTRRGCEECDFKGWVHCSDPVEIQRHDSCGTFQNDEEARKAHRKDHPGCEHPEFDYVHRTWRDLTDAQEYLNKTPGMQKPLELIGSLRERLEKDFENERLPVARDLDGLLKGLSSDNRVRLAPVLMAVKYLAACKGTLETLQP